MAGIKSWSFTIIADKIVYDEVRIWKNGDYLHWSRHYHFEDDKGNVIRTIDNENMVVGSFVEGDMPWANVPQSVKDALLVMDNYTKHHLISQGFPGLTNSNAWN